MSECPILALRTALIAHLATDAALADLMGGALRLHDEPPRAASGIYAVFGEAQARDWSTGSDRGHEQNAAIIVWSKEGGAKPALAAAARLASLIDGTDLPLSGHRLVNLTITATEAARDKGGNLARVTLRLRAVTELI